MSNLQLNVLGTIDAFLRREGDLSVLNDFDRAMEIQQSRLPSRDGQLPGPQVAWALFELSRDHFYLMRVAERKLSRLAEGIAWAIKAENPTVHLSLVRSLLEHVAALAFQVRRLERVEEELSRQSDLTGMMAGIERHRAVVYRLYYGESPKAKTAEVKQFRVEELREALADEYPNEPAIYDTLCEFVHPNHGSNYLVSSGTLGSGMLDRPVNLFAREIGLANECVVTCLDLATRYAARGAALLINLDGRIQIASRPGTRVTTIFSEKGLAHEGDGRSKETAICFYKARIHKEAVEMVSRFLELSGKTIIGPQRLGAIEAGFVYDILPTDVGDVWFRIKMDWGS